MEDTTQNTSDQPPVAGESYVCEHTCVMVGGERALLVMTVGGGGMIGAGGVEGGRGRGVCVWKP